jgi:hypothetical protein
VNDPFALLSPEIASACQAAIGLAVDDFRTWATRQLDLIEQADGAGATARNARQYLRNGRGARVFLKREVEMTEKAVNSALAALAKNPDSLRAIIQLELSRLVHDDAMARQSSRAAEPNSAADFDQDFAIPQNTKLQPLSARPAMKVGYPTIPAAGSITERLRAQSLARRGRQK